MVKSWNLPEIAAAFAPAAFDPAQWSVAMDHLVDAVGATGAALIPFVVDDRLHGMKGTAGAAELLDWYIKEGWYKNDPRAQSIPKLLATGIAADQDIATPEDMRRSPYYNDQVVRVGFRWFCGISISAGPDNWCLAIHRSNKQGPFTSAEQKRLAFLRGSLTTVATVARELGFAQARGMADAFDMTATAAFLLDRQGQVIGTNDAAEAMLGHGLRVIKKYLTANDDQTSSALGQLVRRAIGGTGTADVIPPVAVSRAGRRPLVAHALPLAGAIRDVFCSARGIVVVRDLDARPHPPDALLRECFGLTAAEARLAMRLASGQALQNVANELGIAYETARNQLKVVFVKTGTHRQGELVSLIARASTALAI